MYCSYCGQQVDGKHRSCPHCGRDSLGAAPPPSKRSKTLVIVSVVGAIVVAGIFFVGIIAAIAIPNFLNAVDRGKQKRTMADVRTIATAIEKFSDENERYPTAESIDALEDLLAPDYIRSLPSSDGWRQPLDVASSEHGYVLRSPGKDGVFEASEPRGPTQSFADDIVFADGKFVQWPEGRQQ